jgi:hypothetical protein
MQQTQGYGSTTLKVQFVGGEAQLTISSFSFSKANIETLAYVLKCEGDKF